MIESIPTLSSFALFSIASLVVAGTPGPTWMYVISVSAKHGALAGAQAVMGNLVGIAVHVILAGAGLVYLFQEGSVAQFLLGFGGGAWLIYLGYGKIQSAQKQTALVEQSTVTSPKRKAPYFRDLALINTLNPKVPILFLALMPQFLDATKDLKVQSFSFGILHAFIATSILSLVVIFVSYGFSLLNDDRSDNWVRSVQFVGGLIIAAFGLRTLQKAISSWPF